MRPALNSVLEEQKEYPECWKCAGAGHGQWTSFLQDMTGYAVTLGSKCQTPFDDMNFSDSFETHSISTPPPHTVKQEPKRQGSSLLKTKEDGKERKHEIHFKSLQAFSCQRKDAVKGPRKINIINLVTKVDLNLVITGEPQNQVFYMLLV